MEITLEDAALAHGLQPYDPSDKQKEAHAAPQTWLLFGGAEYGGKTRMMIEEFLTMMLEYPGLEALMCRYDYADLVEPTQARDLFFKCCPETLYKADDVYKSPPSWVRLKNGSRVTFTGLKDYKASSEYGLIGIDQAEEVPEATLRLLRGRLRQQIAKQNLHRRMILTCNPHPNLEWFLAQADKYPKDYKFIVSLPQDNPMFTPEFLEERRRDYTEDQFRRLMLGHWDVFQGQALAEFDRNIHIVEPFTTWQKEGWPVYRGIAWGLSAPTVCEWVTVSPDGDIFFVQEYEQANVSPSENAMAIAAMSIDMNLAGSWIDPRTAEARDLRGQSKNRYDEPEWSVFKEFQHQGVYCQLGQGKRENRLSAWKKGLKVDPSRRSYITHQSGSPMVYIFKNCTRLLYELPRVQYRTALQGFGDDIIKQDDHAYDAGGFALTHLLLDQPTIGTKYVGKTFIGVR